MYSIPLELRFCQETSLQEENFQAAVWWAILVPFNHLVKNSQTTAAAVSSKIQNFIPLSLLGSLTPCLLVCSGALQPTLQYWKVSLPPLLLGWKRISGTLSFLDSITISCSWWRTQQFTSDGSSVGKISPITLRGLSTKNLSLLTLSKIVFFFHKVSAKWEYNKTCSSCECCDT